MNVVFVQDKNGTVWTALKGESLIGVISEYKWKSICETEESACCETEESAYSVAIIKNGQYASLTLTRLTKPKSCSCNCGYLD